MFAIESANIVGYTTKEAPKGKFIIMGAQFEGVKGGTAINDLIGGVTGVNFDDGLQLAPQLQIPNAQGGYTVYYYFNDGWVDDGTKNGAFVPGWCDNEGNIVNVETTPGVAMWLKTITTDANVNVSGAVADVDSAKVSCPENFALRANVFPIIATLNSSAMKTSEIAGFAFDDGLKVAPQIQIPNAQGGYTVYYYFNDGWVDDGTKNGAFVPGWCDNEGNIVDNVTIPAAQGFWTKGVGSAFTLEFTK